MKEISLNESKSIMLKILGSIDKCCRDNNIKYSLCWGTMIGAIRHHGFIPWDDDIDIMMPREDYNRFLEVYNDSEYGVYTPKVNRNCIQIITKIYNKDTKIYIKQAETSFGVWVSIFPYDNVPDKHLKGWEMRRNFWMHLYHFKTSLIFSNDKFSRHVIKILLKAIMHPFSSYWLYGKVEKSLIAYNGHKTRRVCIWTGVGLTKTTFLYFPREWFDECLDVDFENVRTKIIKEYDQFLRFRYGDYMKFPPESERVPKHNYKAYYVEK